MSGYEEDMLEGKWRDVQIYFLRNEQPSVRRALPPVGWQRTVEHPAQITTVCACEKTVVIVKQPGHLTSMKNDLGPGTRVCEYILAARIDALGIARTYLELVLASLSGWGRVQEVDSENLMARTVLA